MLPCSLLLACALLLSVMGEKCEKLWKMEQLRVVVIVYANPLDMPAPQTPLNPLPMLPLTLRFPLRTPFCVASPFARCKSQQTLKSTHSAGRSKAGRTQGRGSAHCIGVHFMMQNMLDEHVEAESEAQLGWHRRRRSETFFDTLWKAESSRKLLENIKYAFNISL